MRRAELAEGGSVRFTRGGDVVSGSRASSIVANARVQIALAWLLSFMPVVLLAADSGGYWPTAWNWTALTLLFVCALMLVARGEVRVGRFEGLVPLALLGLTLWGIVSAAWSASATQPILQSQQTLVYAAAAFAALLVVRSGSDRALLGGIWAAITLICSYALLTRLFPERLGYTDSIAGYRLEAPLGYWNALAIFAAIGTLLAAGFIARGRHPAVRVLAAASTVILVPTLYFTFSRGGWLALGAGLVTIVILDTRRLQFLASLTVVAPWPALAVFHASGSQPLTHIGGGLVAAEHAGHHYLVFLIGVGVAAGVTMVAFTWFEGRVKVPDAVRVAYAGLLVLVVVFGFVAAAVRYGSPVTIGRKGYDNIVGVSGTVQNGNLNTRLFSLGLGQRVPQWEVAWREYKAHPLLGSGLGSYERYWNEYRTENFKVKNVHNLYLETLAELGPVGLALLLVALSVPLVGAVKARRRTLTSAAAAAYVAFLLHAVVDWDWQMPAVTLAALFSGVALLVAARRSPASPARPLMRGAAFAVVLALGAFAFVGLKGNIALASSTDATAHAEFAKAAREAKAAQTWAPWSATPWQLLGEAQSAMGKRVAARASFRKALAKNQQDWTIWLDLAVASSGAERTHAFAEATQLDPLSPEIASWKASVPKASSG